MKKLLFSLVILCFLAIPLNGFAAGPVNVASKGFTEQIILGKIMVQLLKDRGIPVKDRTSLGGTNVNREALEQGQIDVYMEYTGTAWFNFFKKKETVRDSMGLYEPEAWRPRVSDPVRYASAPIPRYRGTVARWHAHLRGLATAIHEISGLGSCYQCCRPCEDGGTS